MSEEKQEQWNKESIGVLLKFAYFIESQRTQDIANLLQRLSILIAANAAVIGLWGNLIFQLIPKLRIHGVHRVVLIEALLVPLLLLGASVLTAARAIRYQRFSKINPDKIIDEKYVNLPPEKAMYEIAGQYGNNWTANLPKQENRTRLFNLSLILLLIALGLIIIVSCVTAFVPIGG